MTDRRTFLQFMAMAGCSALVPTALRAQQGMEQFYDLPKFGNVSVLHMSDLQAQWKPLYYREPDLQLEVVKDSDRPPYLSGDALLQYYNLMIGSAQAYAFSNVDYAASANDYGRLGGVAYLVSLIEIVRKSRKNAWLLDGGNGQVRSSAPWASVDVADSIIAALGINAALPTGRPVKDIDYIARNLIDKDTGKAPFSPYILTQMNGVAVAVIGQVAHNEISEWVASLDIAGLQNVVDEVRQKGARAVLLLSRAGVEADLKLASRMTGIDVILGGRSLTPLPEPISVSNKTGKTLVTNAGGQGRFLAVLDMNIGPKGMTDFRYNLLPVVQSFVQPNRRVAELIDHAYLASKDKLTEKLAVTDGMLYRRGLFNGPWDEVVLQAMRQETGSQVALFPGYRWGPTVLAGTMLTREDIINVIAMGETNIKYGTLRGNQILDVLEEAANDCFNQNAFKRTEIDMMRTGGLTYRIDPDRQKGRRITNVIIGDQPLQPDDLYKVATWGVPVSFVPQAEEPDGAGVRQNFIDKRPVDKSEPTNTVTELADSRMDSAITTDAEQSQSLPLQELLANYLKHKKKITAVKGYQPDVVRSGQ